MNISTQLAKNLRDVYFGGNWTWVSLKDTLADVNWEQATSKIAGFNTIAALVFHIDYFVQVATKVLQGGPLEGKDELSFDHPPLHSGSDWAEMLENTWKNAENFAKLIEQVPEQQLWAIFSDQKYGNYYRNIQGITEHAHYHLGQIVLLKKLVNV